jgi:hypothetical protein
MSNHAVNVDRLFDLMGGVCDECVSEEGLAELDSMVSVDPDARDYYVGYCRMHSALELELSAHHATQVVFQQIGIRRCHPQERTFAVGAEGAPVCPTSTTHLGLWHGTVGFFSSGWPAAYLVATVIFGVGLLIGASTHVSRHDGVASISPPTAAGHPIEPLVKTNVVGRITGMIDCKWVDDAEVAINGAPVSLGHKYALVSGLMEITYDTGAKVTLQGPVTYAVESKNGGFLPIGKLTGKVEVDAAKGFSVRTPTATVTDLGTVFGIDVQRSGQVDVCVHSGRVTIQGADASAASPAVVLKAGEAKRIPSANPKSWITLDAKETGIAHPLTIARPRAGEDVSGKLLFSDHFQSFSLADRWRATGEGAPNAVLEASIDGDRTVLSMRSQAEGIQGKAIETVEPISLERLKTLTVETLFQPRQGYCPSLEVRVTGGLATARIFVQPMTRDGSHQIGADVTCSEKYHHLLSPADLYWDYRYYRFVLSLDAKGVTASFKDSVNAKPLWQTHFNELKLADFGGAVKIMLRQVTHSADPSECNVDWLKVSGQRIGNDHLATPNDTTGK